MDRLEVYDEGLRVLASFARENTVRGRFVALLLGLRRMGDEIAPVGSAQVTPALEIERFLDDLFTKVHVAEPFVVLTAPFGGSTSPTAPYSSRSATTAPGHRSSTNTWRNNFGIQKGVGCPAESATIVALLGQPSVRLACPHMQGAQGQFHCGLAGTSYRGEEHSIWLRQAGGGYQVVDLDEPNAYEPYLRLDTRIPLFALMAVLYGMSRAFPQRPAVGIPEFSEDFRFSLDQVEDLFDVDPDSRWNASVIAVASTRVLVRRVQDEGGEYSLPRPADVEPGAIPTSVSSTFLNSGVGAEIAVAMDLGSQGWEVGYRGNQRGIGYDLEATRGDATLRIEVKSSVGFAGVDLLPSEWEAAQRWGDEYVVAAVDFYGSPAQQIWYIRNPSEVATPNERHLTTYQFDREHLVALRTEAEFL